MEVIDQFIGRTWLLHPVHEWLDRGDSSTLVITGTVGTGKSSVAAWLAGWGPVPRDEESRKHLAAIRSKVKATHFCVANAASVDPRNLAANMARQLQQNVPGFTKALAAIMGSPLQISSNVRVERAEADATIIGTLVEHLDIGDVIGSGSFHEIVLQPLADLYRHGNFQEIVLLIIDAVDEAETFSGGTKIVQILEAADLPPNVRLLVTTRPDPRVLKYLRGAPFVDLIAGHPQTIEDIRQYAGQQLREAEDPRMEALADRIAEAAEGIFLYAHLVLQDLLPQLRQVEDPGMVPLPSGMTGVFTNFLNRELGRDEDRWFSLFRPLLGAIAVAKGDGLTRNQLSFIVGRDVEQALRICKQYLIGDLPNGPFRVFHQSFAEFLLHDRDNVDYPIDARAMNAQVAFGYHSVYRGRWSEIDQYATDHLLEHLREADGGRKVDTLTEQNYGTRFLVYHMRSAGMFDQIGMLVDHLLTSLKKSD